MAQETTALKCEDIALLAILDVLEADLGTTRGRKELGVNYRTFAKCRDTREVTPLMRRELKKYVGWGPVVDSPVIVNPPAGEEEAYGSTEDPYETLSLRVEDLEAENRELRQANETQTAHIADWAVRLASLGERRLKVGAGGLLPWKRHTYEGRRISLKGSWTHQSLGSCHVGTPTRRGKGIRPGSTLGGRMERSQTYRIHLGRTG